MAYFGPYTAQNLAPIFLRALCCIESSLLFERIFVIHFIEALSLKLENATITAIFAVILLNILSA